jgi:hypothetical protein
VGIELMTLIPFFVPARGAPAAVATFVDSTESTGDLTTYTFAGHAIGDAATGRHVLIGIGASGSAGQSDRTISSVTVGGDAATAVGTLVTSTSTATTYAVFYIIQVDSGTTADIVVTWSGDLISTGIGVWALYNLLSATPTDTGTGVLSGTNIGIDAPARGVIVGYAHTQRNGAGGATHTWANLSERFDEQIDAGNSDAHTGASDAFGAAESNRLISVTFSAGTTIAITLAAFR